MFLGARLYFLYGFFVCVDGEESDEDVAANKKRSFAQKRNGEAVDLAFSRMDSVLSVLSYLLKAPMVPKGTPVVNALFKQRSCVENILRACVGALFYIYIYILRDWVVCVFTTRLIRDSHLPDFGEIFTQSTWAG